MTSLPPQPLSPLDGRYRAAVEGLGEHLSEAGLNRARVHVEVEWLIMQTDRRFFGSTPLSADQRTIDALERAGYDGTHHRARQFDAGDFPALDLVVAFDRGQARILRNQAPTAVDHDKVRLLLDFDPELAPLRDVPDPYYSDDATFDRVLGMIERSTSALFRQLAPALRQGNR